MAKKKFISLVCGNVTSDLFCTFAVVLLNTVFNYAVIKTVFKYQLEK